MTSITEAPLITVEREVPAPFIVQNGAIIIEDENHTVLDAEAVTGEIQRISCSPETIEEVRITAAGICKRIQERPQSFAVLYDAAAFMWAVGRWPTIRAAVPETMQEVRHTRRELQRTLAACVWRGSDQDAAVIEAALALLPPC